MSEKSGSGAKLEGKIVEVMETWPLQLTVACAEGTIHTMLRIETSVHEKGAMVDARRLRPGHLVHVDGNRRDDKGFVAASIVVVGEEEAPSPPPPAEAPQAAPATARATTESIPMPPPGDGVILDD